MEYYWMDKTVGYNSLTHTRMHADIQSTNKNITSTKLDLSRINI